MFSIRIYNVRCSERTRPKREFDSVAVNVEEGEKGRPVQNSKTITREDIRNRYVKKRLFVIIIIFYPAKPNGIGDIVINGRTRYFHNMFSTSLANFPVHVQHTYCLFALSPSSKKRAVSVYVFAQKLTNIHTHKPSILKHIQLSTKLLLPVQTQRCVRAFNRSSLFLGQFL